MLKIESSLAGWEDVIAFDGETVNELETSFRNVVEDYWEGCQRMGKDSDKPCTGRFT
ncbi:hypothetical protein [Acaryochloris marina]|uniref:hypothetical protein n=1 Tax=Acaryochloris marina TaxID=155978 RepID=UPI002016C763|nr:hypothetical protein [Acaryochloris marina]